MQGQLSVRTEPIEVRALPRRARQKVEAGTHSRRLSDVGSLTLLIALALALRLFLLWNTEVAARDSIGYIRYAWQLQHQPWKEVLRKTEQPPLYALVLLGVSTPLRHLVDAPDSVLMQLSAQLTSALAGILLVIPSFLLGKELFDRNVGFWAALLFQSLPATGRFLSDGLSEAMFLLFAAFSLWLAVRALRTQSALGFGLSGLCGGLAYLTRTEGGLILAATGLVLIGCQVVRAWRFPLKGFLSCAACLALAALLLAGPYMAVIGHITNKKSIIESTTGLRVDAAPAAPPAITTGVPLAVWYIGDQVANKTWWGLWALGSELSRGAFHVGWVAALVGFWSYRHRLRAVPGIWLLLLLSAAMALALWQLARVMGYLSDRHCLIILFCAMFWIAAGFKAIGGWLSGKLQPYLGEWNSEKGMWRQLVEQRLTSPRAVAAILLLGLLGIALPKTLEPLHGNRAGLRQAGLWLLANADSSGRCRR